MAYSESLASRLREALDGRGDITERKMFGGLGFMAHGHMAVAAVSSGGLMVRCDPADVETHVQAGAEPMVMQGRAMKGWLLLAGDSLTDADLARWVDVGLAFADALDPK